MKGNNIDSARRLRLNATTAENILWQHLRNRQFCSKKWRRQQPIGDYIVDFFCAELRLVVEIDGDVHDHLQDRDASRQHYLEDQWLEVVRFNNDDVFRNLDGVLERLWEIIHLEPGNPSP